MAKKTQVNDKIESSSSTLTSSIFGNDSTKIDSNINNLFAQPSKINNRDLIASKVRTVVEIPNEVVLTDKDVVEPMEIDNQKEQQKQPVESKKRKIRSNNNNDDDDDENDDLESKYMEKLLNEDKDDEDNDSKKNDTQKDSTTTTKTTRSTKAKTIDLKNDELEKAERTVFVGNVPSIILSDKKLTKEFKNFFSKFGKIDSIRFRSINTTGDAPRKVSFINKEFDDKKTSNSYVVFIDKQSSIKCSSELNGKVFMNHHLRVDHLTHPLKQDNQRSIFIGNLDFEETEENLWKFFNDKFEKENDGKKVVENVRIVRDPKTNFGKGFAIVQFNDTNFVSKSLLLNDTKLTTSLKPRKMRISRAKKMINKNQNTTSTRKNLTDKQKTIIGRGKKLLNKSDRNTIGRLVIEGERSKKGSMAKGLKNGKKKPRSKDGRVTKRSQEFRKKLADSK
ncbi:unnamed protein product [[Candida] boidinii]|nr:unnamed protein product [[Candida] boidinii]